MSNVPHVSHQLFETRFPQLVSGRYLLPKHRRERQMLLLSSVCELATSASYSEREINEHLSSWIDRFGADLTVDFVTLRRYLIDEAILERDRAGTSYSLSQDCPHFTYDASIRSIDLAALVAEAQAARALRKRAYLDASASDQ